MMKFNEYDSVILVSRGALITNTDTNGMFGPFNHTYLTPHVLVVSYALMICNNYYC